MRDTLSFFADVLNDEDRVSIESTDTPLDNVDLNLETGSTVAIA